MVKRVRDFYIEDNQAGSLKLNKWSILPAMTKFSYFPFVYMYHIYIYTYDVYIYIYILYMPWSKHGIWAMVPSCIRQYNSLPMVDKI